MNSRMWSSSILLVNQNNHHRVWLKKLRVRNHEKIRQSDSAMRWSLPDSNLWLDLWRACVGVLCTSGHKMPKVHCACCHVLDRALHSSNSWKQWGVLRSHRQLLSVLSSLSLFFPLGHSLFKQVFFILDSESAVQSACGLYPSASVLNKVVHSAVKSVGRAAVPLRTWERTADGPTLIYTSVSRSSVCNLHGSDMTWRKCQK